MNIRNPMVLGLYVGGASVGVAYIGTPFSETVDVSGAFGTGFLVGMILSMVLFWPRKPPSPPDNV